jgi:hypothetical protein
MKNDQRREIIDICKRRGIPYVGVVRNNERYQMMECEKSAKSVYNNFLAYQIFRNNKMK